MKDGHTTKSESSIGKKLWCVLLVLFLGGIGWQIWKLNAYNNAVRQAKEAGFTWKCDDAISLIRQDWHNALKKETWGEHPRVLWMGEGSDRGRYRELLHQLRPTHLHASGCKDENLDGLKGLTNLKVLELGRCTALQNVEGLKSLTSLQKLSFSFCTALQNIDGLKGLTGLQELSLWGCDALQKVDGLNGITALQSLDLISCPALQNVDGLKGLTGLKTLRLGGCDKIPATALRELRAALPKTDIMFPDGSKSPPQ